MQIFVHAYIHTHILTCIHTYIYAYVNRYIHNMSPRSTVRLQNYTLSQPINILSHVKLPSIRYFYTSVRLFFFPSANQVQSTPPIQLL